MEHYQIGFGRGVDKYPAKAHVHRVVEKLQLDKGLIVLAGAQTQFYPHCDSPIPFRQERYFYYLTGCPERDCYMTYHIADDRLTLWLPQVDKARVVYNGRGSTIREAMEKYDIDEALYIHSVGVPGSSTVKLFSQKHLSSYGEADAFIYLDSPGLKQAMNACRVIKDEYEIDLVTRANEVSTAGHTAILQLLHTFKNEAEMEAVYMQQSIANHAKQAYTPIVGAGTNASVLHYSDNDQELGNGQTVVIDAGCEVDCYAADVTRTLPLNPKLPGHWPSTESKQVYELVEKMQEECIKRMKTGTTFVEVSQLARHIAIDGLLKLGVLNGDHEEIFAAGTDRGFFPHGLGHHLGLDVHDVSPNLPPPMTCRSHMAGLLSFRDFVTCDAFAQVLQPGMIVTVEPGIYFNKYLLKTFYLDNPKHSKYINRHVLKQYMGVGGVRIEDDILVTKHGYRNLTTAPKGEEMLEIIRAAADRERCGP